MKRVKIISIALLLTALLAAGCTKEDLTMCGVDLRFRYDYNIEETDQFAPRIGKLDLYVFNSAGLFLERYEIEGPFDEEFRMRLDLPAGTYNFVVWGDRGDEFVVSPLTSISTRQATALNEATLSLTSGNGGRIETFPTGLYYGAQMGVEIRPYGDEVQLSLIKNTKAVTAVFNGLPLTAETAGHLVCRVEAVNGNYTFANTLTGGNRRLTYVPQTRMDFSEDPVVSFDFVTMRLFADNRCQSRLILEYRPSNGGSVTKLFDVKLTDVIKQMYKDVDFDRRSEYELQFDCSGYNFADLTIAVNGWIVTESPSGWIW
jgi:hypothetical protein